MSPTPQTIATTDDAPHYPSEAARLADRWAHVVGVSAGAVGGLGLLGLSLSLGHWREAAAIAVYAAGLIGMLVASAAYNLASPERRPVLRRFDHAAIFLMIAGSYTPFTTQRLSGSWAVGMTLAVWALALAGALGKLFLPGLAKGFWVVLYLALGWVVVAAIGPLTARVSVPALVLLAAGGFIYSAGVLIYLRKSLTFGRAIWHSLVIAAAALQFAAILIGVVLAGR